MEKIPGYSLTEVLGEDREFVLFRGQRKDGHVPILALVPASEHPPPSSINRLEHEFFLRSDLDPAWAAQPLSLEHIPGKTALVLADPGGELLVRRLGKPMDPARFLSHSISLLSTLGKVHQKGLLHKNLKPANILVDAAAREVHFLGFGIATQLPRERQAPDPPEAIAGTLAYMAPEQTGRMNRSINSRSDLYSMGVILYEMLTGELPFTATDPLELIHCHIARQPARPDERAERVPSMLADIVLKLLAKTAEERYQTAAGAVSDLEKCLAEWNASGRIEPFPLGERDHSDRMQIPEKLYGRETESRMLLDAFDRVVSTGKTEMVLVSGYSGIGKSALVNELHKVIVPPRGMYAAGKFDQFKRDIPYATLAQAFRTLVRQILGKSEEEAGAWRDAIRSAVGVNGRLLVDLIPEVEFLIGKQPAVPALPSLEAQNRFHAVFRAFLGAFAKGEHPLVLFLDDLQWLDPASLQLMEHLVTHPQVRHLLLIGAYRENEVGSAHPLPLTLDSARKAGALLHNIMLAPLSQGDLGRLLADTLHCDPQTVAPLAALVHEKTAGNPFFSIQFISALYEDRMLRFDARKAAWTWDMQRIRAMGMTDNVIELMAGKLKRLPEATQSTLKWMACVGNRADAATLAEVRGGAAAEMHADLREAILSGILIKSGDEYQFLHDRVREAAYALIPEKSRAEKHLRIGRVLLSRDAAEDRVFELANQFNLGAALLTDPAEKETVFRLNAQAGGKAKASTAFASARHYLAQAMALLPPDPLGARYEEVFALMLDFSECEYLLGHFDRADEYFNTLLENARTKVDRAKVYGLRLKLYQVSGKFADVVKTGCESIGLFGIQVPESDADLQAAIEAELREIPANMRGRKISELLDMPAADDPEVWATIGLLTDVSPATWMTAPRITPLLVLRAVNLSLRFGNTEASCCAYSFYASLLIVLFDDPASAFEFSEMALKLVERFDNARQRGALLTSHGATIQYWRESFGAICPVLERAFAASINIGDIVNAGYAAIGLVWNYIERGDAIDDVLTAMKKYLGFTQETRNGIAHQMIRQYELFLAGLKGLPSSDDASRDFLIQAGYFPGVHTHYTLKQFVAYVFERYDEARMYGAKALELFKFPAWTMHGTQDFIQALTLAASGSKDDAEKSERLASLRETLKKLKHYADNCPGNFLHRYSLAAAELARVEGRDLDAMRLYDEAIASSRTNGFPQYEALANESAAKFYFSHGLKKNANGYLRDARYAYLRWGALGKVRQLDEAHPGLEEKPPAGPTFTVEVPGRQLDSATVLKASQAVSGEIVLEKLIEKLLAITVENVGAERALLILPGDTGHAVEAEARTSREGVKVTLKQEPVSAAELPESIFQYVNRTQEMVLMGDASAPNQFSEDEYIRRARPHSMLCLPLVKQAKLVGVLYLENNLARHAFTSERVSVLKVLATQAAISLENARLYDGLQKENAERRRAERALRESRELLQSIIDNSGAVVFVKDLEGKYLLVNRRYAQLIGREPQAISGKTDQEVFPAELANGFRDKDVEVAESGKPSEGEETVLLPDGPHTFVSIRCPLFDASGKPYAVAGIATDVTRFKQVEEQLRHAQKMEAIARLTSGIAHDFNNLLTAINGYSEMALMQMDASHPLREWIQEIRKSGERAAQMTRQLLAYGRKQILATRVWNLNAILLDMEGMLRRLISENIRLAMIPSTGLGLVKVDRGQMEQIILNLVVNARDAMPNGGSLSLETSPFFADQGFVSLHPEFAQGPYVLLTVRDSGTGMTPEVMSKIFEPFFTTKGEGTGLGLAMVFGIVEQSGGHVAVDSKQGYGTTFRIYFPEAAEEAPSGPAQAPRARKDLRGDETIMLVEDDESVRRFVAMSLRGMGYTVLEARDGADALKQLEKSGYQPALLITDLVMPGMDGKELGSRIRRERPALPVIYISGYAEQAAIPMVMEGSGEAFLQKPFSPEVMAVKVRELLEWKKFRKPDRYREQKVHKQSPELPSTT